METTIKIKRRLWGLGGYAVIFQRRSVSLTVYSSWYLGFAILKAREVAIKMNVPMIQSNFQFPSSVRKVI